MVIHGKIQYKDAIIVNEKLLTDLEKIILSFYNKVFYECKLCNDDIIEFESLVELLSYKNIKSRKIVRLKIKFDYNDITFEPTSSLFSSYKYTVVGNYKVDDPDKSILFSEKIEKVLESYRRSKLYTFLTKISMVYFFIFFLGITMGAAIVVLIEEGVMGGSTYTTNSLNLSMIIGVLIAVISGILSKCRNTLLPSICFMIGEQIEEIKRNEDRFSKIFWGVIVAFIVSFIVTKIT